MMTRFIRTVRTTILTLCLLALAATARADQWRNVLPSPSPRYYDPVVIDPSAPSTLYAGADAGLFRSTDAGQTWVALLNGLPAASVYSIAISPSLKAGRFAGPGTIYVLIGRVVYRSSDGGATWHAGPPCSLPVGRIVADPSDANIVYRVRWTNDPSRTGETTVPRHEIDKSVDGGASWLPTGSASIPYICGNQCGRELSDLAIDAANPRILYAGF